MANRFLAAVLIGGMAVAIGCGGTDDESVFLPTPTQGPPTPTPLPICRGVDIPAGLGGRPFTWTQPEASDFSGSQLFATLPRADGTFNFFPVAAAGGLDPGGRFIDVPPGMCLVAGQPDQDGVATVTIGVAEENQLAPGFLVIGVKPISDYICFKLDLATVEGTLYCNGSDTQGVDTRITAGPGVTSPEEDVIEFDLGDSASAGSVILKVIQQQGRIRQSSDPRYETCFTLPECGPGERLDCYRPRQLVGFTTGTVFGTKGLTPLLNAEGGEGLAGESFDCASWTTVDGPGQLVEGLADFEPLAGGDFTTAFRIDD